jgi:4-aminobutyrate aminotransferase-like enzyme
MIKYRLFTLKSMHQRSLTEEEILEMDNKYVIRGWPAKSIVVVGGEGAVFWDINGKKYIDFFSQTAGVLVLGYKHPAIVEAVKKQVEKSLHVFTGFVTEERAILAKKLAEIAPGKMKDNIKTYFSSGGSEANETALKFALLKTGRKEVIGLWYSYHGGTLATMSLTGQSARRIRLPSFPGFHLIPCAYCYRCVFGKNPDSCDLECARFLEEMIKYGTSGDVAAFIAEPILGAGGHQHPPRKEYWKIIRETCDKYNMLLIIDEVQTGICRTGRIWASELFEIEPDILVSAKALGGGMPLAATMIRSDLLDEKFIKSQWHMFTYGGSPISIAAGIAVIDTITKEKLWKRAEELGKYLKQRLLELMERHKIIGDIRGAGLFLGVELVKDSKTKKPAIEEAERVQAKCLEKGLFLGVNLYPGWGNTLKIKPPVIITKEQIDKAVEILEESLKEVEKGI